MQTGDYTLVGNADMNIAYAEHWVTAAGFPLKWENTTDAVVIGGAGAMFSDGTSALSAPRALFYGGWYNFDHYNNVYQWLAGSIACDLNSAPYFGTQALLHGASAASYVVSEPYLNGHQRPEILYYYILKGYDFAEASALATPFIGWMAVNEGDPLYAPNQPKTPVVDTTAPILEAGYPQATVSAATGITTVNLPINDIQGPEVVAARVNYGPDTNYGSIVNSAPGFSRTPSVLLPSTAGQTNHYQVTLTDPVGNIWTSGDFTFAGNAPPTIAAPASATPSPVTGAAAAVTVLGADDGGESNLTYTWSATGPAPVAFNTNGTNASKNSTAVFTKAGAYSLRVAVKDAFGSTVTSPTSVTVNQTASQIAVTPASASVSIGGTQQFTAAVNDQFGNAVAQAPLTWSVTGGGTISSSGVFTARSTPGGPFTISAASGSLRGTASVSVFANDTTPPTVPANVSASAVSPSAINVGWTASSDNVGVAGYTIYRNGAQVGASTSSTTYADTNLVPNTTYSYTVSAYDTAGNVSTQSAPASATTQGGLTTALLIAGSPAELGLPPGTSSSTTNNLSITPSINQYGLTGTLRVNGTASVNFSPAVSGNGVYFLNCCGNTNNAYYKFPGAAAGSIFNTSQGQISFYLQSRYSFAQRTTNASTTRYAFDVRDANGHLFNFASQVVSGSLEFSYAVAGASEFYFVPKGTENTLFGSGVVLPVTLSWKAGTVSLYLNGTLVTSAAYTPATPNWTASSNFDLGAYEYVTYGGYDVSDDVVAGFTALSNSGGTIAPVVSITSPSSGALLNGATTVTANATDSVGVTGVQFQLDGTNLGSVVTGAGPLYSTSWNAAAAANGSHTLTAVATDAAGNTASSSVSVTVATTPPTISMTTPTSGALLNGTTTVTANATDSLGVTGVQFKLDGANLGGVVTGAGPVYSISWNAATATNGPHTLTAVATDGAGNTASSSVSVTVDTTPPTVSITAPVGGALLNGTTTVTANATDSVGVTGVQFKLDGTNLGSVVTGAGPVYSTSWNAATATNGPHTLTAVATDAAGNTASSSVSVTVDTVPPTVSMTAPISGALLNKTITVTANATDSAGITGVQFKLDGSNLGSVVTGSGPGYNISWNAAAATNGPHTLTALATDAAGNTASSSVSVTVDTTPPALSMITPANGAYLNGITAVTVNATDSVGVTGVQFKLDGANLGAVVTGAGPAYSVVWNAAAAGNGSHTLTAVATDAAGNTASSSVSVTVSTIPPVISLTAPGSGAAVNGVITVTANAADSIPLASVQFQLDGANLGSAVAGPGPAYSFTWDTTTVPDGPHTLTAVAVDAAGNLGTATSVSVTVTNPILLLHADASEVSGVTNGSVVTPAITPAGFTGSVVVNGTASVNYAPAETGNGVYFLNCCSNTNNAYYKFAGASVASVFGSPQGQITFNLQSRYTFAQRSANPTNRRYAFDVRDGNGHQFYFMSQVVSGALEFSYGAAGADWYYYAPKGTEDALFGNGAILAVTLSWNGSTMNLFLNNMLVKSTPYTPPVYNWNAISNFDLGAYEYLTFGGYDSSDDIVDEFTVLPFTSN